MVRIVCFVVVNEHVIMWWLKSEIVTKRIDCCIAPFVQLFSKNVYIDSLMP